MVEEDKNIIDIAKEMAGNERKIVDDFCKAFIAHKILNNENISLIFENIHFVPNLHLKMEHGFKILV